MDKEEIIANECEETGILRSYNLSIIYKEEEREIGITTEEQNDTWEVVNLEFLDNCEKLTEEEKSEIKEWIIDNSVSWLK